MGGARRDDGDTEEGRMTQPQRIAPLATNATAPRRWRSGAPPIPARSVWVGASAGSGKTKVLTDRLLAPVAAARGWPARERAETGCSA